MTTKIKIRLERKHKTEKSIIGELGGGFYTLELPWKENQKDISCIPEGVYECRRKESIRFGGCYELLNVPDRSNILIHAGNTPEHTHGCILLGLVIGHDFVGKSKRAMQIFMDSMPEEFLLEII